MTDQTQSAAPALELLADSLAATAHWAYTNSLAGRAGTHAHHFFEWTSTAKVGQRVVEISTAYGRKPAMQRVGVLQSITDEPYPYEDWDEAEDGQLPTRPIWTIICLDGSPMRWENCQFIAVPTTWVPRRS